jgi:hypothetical protein
VPAVLQVVDGEDQEGTIGEPLPSEVRFRVLDAAGRPVVGATVSFRVTEGGGSLSHEALTTDDAGEVGLAWTLGPAPGRNLLEASTGSLAGVAVPATASVCQLVDCSNDKLAENRSEWRLLDLVTYDGSGQATHPDVTRGGPGLRWRWMMVTPYPNSDITKENPSLYQSRNGRYWRVPRGLTNPIAQPTIGYLSDPDIVFDEPTHRFWMYYRRVAAENEIWLTRSHDAVKWDDPVVVASAPNHEIVSPAVVHNAPHAPWIMFAANTHAGGCISRLTSIERRTSSDGIGWSAPQPTDLAQPGQTIWHLDVVWVPAREEYWALYNTYPNGYSCTTNAVYFARSSDGLHWLTYPAPVIQKGVIDAFRDIVYRSTLLVNAGADSVQLWVSGAKYDGGYVWRTATVTRRIDEFLGNLVLPPPVPQASNLPRRDLPLPEPDIGPVGDAGRPAPPARIRP